MPNHFFVFGIARSGTNLLARMIDRHPSAVCALDPLLPYFKSLRNSIIRDGASEQAGRLFSPTVPFQDNYFLSYGPELLDLLLDSDGNLNLPERAQMDLRAAIVDRAVLESPGLAESLGLASGGAYGTFLDDVLRIVGQSKSGTVWSGTKEVWVIDFLPLLSRMYPEARFFLIERDPRAIVASLLAMAEKDASQAAHFISYARHWRKTVTLSRKFESTLSLRERIQIVSYERLVRNPEEVAREACAHLGLEYRPEMLEVSASGWAGNSSYGDNLGIYGQSTERWRDSLSEANAQAVEFLCAPEMMMTAYRPCSQKLGKLTAEIESVFRTVGKSQASWRSDSGHVSLDVGGELLRYEMLSSGEKFQEAAVRECFLDNAIFGAIRAKWQERPI